jgi:hypothetical protein
MDSGILTAGPVLGALPTELRMTRARSRRGGQGMVRFIVE